MKSIQSLWFKKLPSQIEYTCGWLDIKYNLFSWALSSFQLSRFFNKVDLVTDSLGVELATKLYLPYTSILDDLETVKQNNHLWVFNKLYTYSIQNEPFIHVDTDAYLFNLPDSKLFSAPLVAQNFEYDHSYYIQSFQEVISQCSYLPDIIRTDTIGRLTAVNAGFIGGNTVDFFKGFTAFATEFVERNEDGIIQCNYDTINIFVEQFLFLKFADYKNIPVDYISSIEFGPEPDYQLANFTQLPANCSYIHVMNYKRNPTVCEQMAQRLWLESPELYERVLTVCRELGATHHPISLPVSPQLTPFYRTGYILEQTQPQPLPNLSATELATYVNALPVGPTKTVVQDVFQFESRRQAFITSLPDAATLRRHWQQYSRDTNNLLALPAEEYFQKQIRPGVCSSRIEAEWNWAEANEFASQTADRDLAHNLQTESSYYEIVLCVYLHQGLVREQVLDVLAMLILDAVEAPVCLGSVCDQVLAHQSEVDKGALAETVLSRIRHFLYHGVLEVVS
ncbi:DUF6734 family protein [Spirosoma linguale]|uniref:DUF6734 domain-containing protein n=1 Tax=Spirosoma linguale (strain ATCC 33905 / DSM 74 / LMG 10896 / Claus 1) TaxID=504472 RepID=D2QMK7_SPILD|nr:hypothetical protein Slin_4439 [Spirosoma linguale DSM 74]